MEKENSPAYQRVIAARNPKRPYTMDLLETIFTDFVEIHGDRRFSDDAAMVGGFAKLGNYDVAVIGQQKGRDMKQRRLRNFGMPKPEGYRKALRLMKLAEKFNRPIITLIDTPGAYPGIDAEERGQAEAIALNLREMANLKVPIIIVVLGEGGSGGALAIGIGDCVLMMENSVYSVITPEGCAAILWKDAGQASRAAEGLRLTAENLFELDIIDEVVSEESENGKWEIPEESQSVSEENDVVSIHLKSRLLENLTKLKSLKIKDLLDRRYSKFRNMGSFVTK